MALQSERKAALNDIVEREDKAFGKLAIICGLIQNIAMFWIDHGVLSTLFSVAFSGLMLLSLAMWAYSIHLRGLKVELTLGEKCVKYLVFPLGLLYILFILWLISTLL